MLKLEFEKKEEVKEEEVILSENYFLIVNGRKDLRSIVNLKVNATDQRFSLRIEDPTSLSIIHAAKVSELNNYFYRIIFKQDLPFWRNTTEVRFFFRITENPLLNRLEIIMNFDSLGTWNKPWRFTDWLDSFRLSIIELKVPNLVYSSTFYTNFPNTSFSISYYFEDQDKAIQETLDSVNAILARLIDSSFKKLYQLSDNSIYTLFNFPAHIKTACEQYLVYFAQFLADIGISAAVEIKEDASKTLFKVVPSDKETALETIQEALETYLNLPGNSSFQSQADVNKDIAVIQLEANVQHLNTQIMLSNATMRALQATIEAQEVTIRHLNLNTYRSDIALPTPRANSAPETEEHIIPGILTVKNVDIKGVSIKLPELLRRMKRVFKKKT